MDNQNYLKNCKYVKVILMLIVIMGHSIALWNGNWLNEYHVQAVYKSDSLKLLSNWISSFHVPAFVFASAYIFAAKIFGGGYKRYLPFLYKKIKRLLIPYLFVAFVWVMPITAFLFPNNGQSILTTYFLGVNPSQLWFLWMLFWLFVIYWPLTYFLKNHMPCMVLISLGMYSVGMIAPRYSLNYFCFWTALQYAPIFQLGLLCWLFPNWVETAVGRSSLFWLCIDLLIYFMSLCSVPRVAGILIRFLLKLVGAFSAFIILEKIVSRTKINESGFLNILSKYTMPMYLFHQQIIYFIILWLNGTMSPWINALINFALAGLISFAIGWGLMKNRMTRLLLGEN